MSDIKSYEPKPTSEPGKRVVTSHGDWHTGNMLTRDDGSVIAIDLEGSHVGWASYDAAYFTTLAHLNREEVMIYAKEYLRCTGFDTSEQALRAFVFDIEKAKIFLQLCGLTSLEDQLKKKNVGFTEGLVEDAIVLCHEAESDKAKFDLVVDNGLLYGMFKNNSKLFQKLWEKFSEYCWYFNPEFDQEYVVYDKIFNLKEGITPSSIYSDEMNKPEIMAAKNMPLKCERLEKEHFFVEIMPGVPTLNLHFLNFKKDGEYDFSYEIICGMKPEPPYKLCGYTVNYRFKEFKDGSWNVRLFNNHYKQYAMCEDLRPTLIKSVLDEVEKQFTEKTV